MEKSLVSVLIPVYNGEDTIKQTIDSVVKQTYEYIEIIVIDNQSTDNTVECIKEIKDKRIKFFQNQENLGMVGNWNECLKKACGKYVHFLCADDYIEPDCIEQKVKILDSDDSIVMVTSATQIIDENNRCIMQRKQFNANKILDGLKMAKKSYHKANIYGEPSNVMFRMSTIEKVGGFATNTCYATDWDLWLRISTCGKVAYINKPLTKYRISMSNTTSSISFKRFLKDDSVMTENILRYKKMEINIFDKVIHRVVYIVRMFARTIFMKIKSK